MHRDPQANEINRAGIADHHMLMMAKCILSWARYESHLRALLTSLEKRPLDAGAADYGKLSPEDCWKKIKKELRAQGATDAVLAAVQRNRALSREFYEARKAIVHAGCVGTWEVDEDYVVFAPFESERPGEMTLIWMPLQDIERSHRFAEQALQMIGKLMKSLGF